MKIALKPCPFCCEKDIRIGDAIFYCCYCPDCGVRGPVSQNQTQAKRYWNEMPRDEEEV